jgi:hypothetical protein
MIFGIIGVMEVDVVAELTAHWMVAELVMHQHPRRAASWSLNLEVSHRMTWGQ